MKMFSSLTAVVFAMGVSFTNVHTMDSSDKTKSLDGVKTIVIQCGKDPNGVRRCVQMNFDDGSNCIFTDREGFGTDFICPQN